MARLRVGGPVPCRKQKVNPETITGRPMIGTFQGLGMPSTAKSLQIAASKAGVRVLTNGGRTAGHNLPKGHLCHKAKPKRDYVQGLIRQALEQSKLLSFQLDRTQRSLCWTDKECIESPVGRAYCKHVQYLREFSPNSVVIVVRREIARGAKWFKLVPAERIDKIKNVRIPLPAVHPAGQHLPKSYSL